MALAALPSLAAAQYFGRNKVQYEEFDFRILRTDHFNFYYYPAESLATSDMARAGDRWYTRLSDLFRHTFDRKSIVFYADHPDFQQTNVVGGTISEGTGGITEGLRTRVVMPHTGSYWDTDHVLGHEIVHMFQYSIAEGGPGGINRLGTLPLWLVEGMAEYLSIGRQHSLTAMWLRDALRRDDLPTIKQLNNDSRYFPYRYGQALWAYIGGRYGDRAVVDVYRAALRLGWDPAIRRVLGVNSDSLSQDWIAAIRAQYAPHLAGRTHPDSVGQNVVRVSARGGDYNVSPVQSPDGRHVAFFSSRDLFGIDLYLADAQTGRVIKRLASPNSGRHLDAISFIQSSGDFSPDGSQFAFIAFAEGDHEIQLLDVASTSVVRRVQVPGVGAMNSLAWSPDGRTIAFSGMVGGISDIYAFDVAAGTVRQLTNDRYADLHPAWSPDGRTIAFSSDRGPGTSFQTMTYSRMQLATVDVATGRVDVLSPFPSARHISPQYTPDGRSLLFVADPDGVNNIFRLDLAGGSVTQVTNVVSGISGITDLSPAMSIAENTGRLMFNVFQNQGHAIVALSAEQTQGTPVQPMPAFAAAAMLPPGDTPGRAPITTYLADALTGLPSTSAFEELEYRPKFALDAIGQPSVGVSAGGPFGTGVSGGVSAYFGDQLGDRMIGTSIQANGQLKDIGGQLFYLNMKRRFNWGGSLSHVPYLSLGQGFSEPDPGDPADINYDLYMQRLFYTEASAIGQYPFSTTRRAEFTVAATRIGYDLEVQRTPLRAAGTGFVQAGPTALIDLGAPDSRYLAKASAALVGDWSNFGFTSPVQGGRYRLEVSPTIGDRTYASALADYRRYHFFRPVTFAWRALHYGNYGRDSEDWDYAAGGMSYPLYLGEPSLVRGYAYNSFGNDECIPSADGSSGCPVVSRLIGSRLAVASAEIRIPLIGTRDFGLINLPFIPIEMAPFFDAGVMWTSDQPPQLRTDADPVACDVGTARVGACAQRTPVFSSGVSFRANVLGYLILEAYIAHPFQRPQKNWVWGFQLMPGW
ncbi:MAG: PD40 domain-containing protein [Gemmatimonadaceae bacterium]|nr:PD40 domain-containing protein [Gemmatimonadaceae bacterium]